jgi:hypothetical protein
MSCKTDTWNDRKGNLIMIHGIGGGTIEQEFPGSAKIIPWSSVEIFRGYARLIFYMVP